MEIIEMDLTDIKPYWKNPRDNDKAVDSVVESIKRYGFNQPILIDSSHTIVAGHTRYKALLKMGKVKASVIVNTELTKEQAKEYRIADNKTAEVASWDMKMLIPELRGLETMANMDIFFPKMNLEFMLESSQGSQNAQKEVTTTRLEHAAESIEAIGKKRPPITNHLVNLVCPACGEEFGLDSDQIAARAIDSTIV